MDENTENKAMRLAKYLANAGIASRRRCEELIAEGRITVNGAAVTTPVCLVTPGVDTVCHEGAPVTLGAKEYYIFNKPRGYTCTSSDPHAKRIIYDLLPPDMKRLFYIGRLDRDTEGLLLLTNDGELAELLAHPSHGVQKRYVADCTGSYTEETARRMTEGLTDAGEFIRARQVQLLRREEEHSILEIILTEGKKREVRRLCAATGLEVVRLARVSLGNLQLGDLPSGDIRPLTEEEVSALRDLALEASKASDDAEETLETEAQKKPRKSKDSRSSRESRGPRDSRRGPRREFGDSGRPKREYGESSRPRRENGESRGPRREYDESSRGPKRDYGESSRPRREYGESRGPRREYDESSRGPRREYGESSRPRREYGESRGPRKEFGESGRPRREYGESRGPRKDFGESRGPRKDFGESRGPRKDFGESRGPRRDYGESRGPRKEFGESRGPRKGFGDSKGPKDFRKPRNI